MKNCPNCGAPITFIKCPYCGTMVFDFAVIDDKVPTFIRIKYGNDILTFKSLPPEVNVEGWADEPIEIHTIFRPLVMNDKGALLYLEKGEEEE